MSTPVSPPNPASSVAAAWFGNARLEVVPPPPPGFSGSPLVKVRPRGAGTWFLLKAFGPGTARARAEWIHALLRHVASRGVTEVPLPLATPTGGTVVADAGGTLWEALPFVVGSATETPAPGQAAAALRCLARLHRAAATLPNAAPEVGPSPGVERRRALARELIGRPWRMRRATSASGGGTVAAAVAARWDRALGIFDTAGGGRAVTCLADVFVGGTPLQAVLRDVWYAHVLFDEAESDRVAGIVDAQAAGIDSPAVDIARLLGSWRQPGPEQAADLAAAWPDAIAAYESIRPLADAERGLVPLVHAASVLGGLDNWFRWTVEERRSFADPAAVLTRIDRLIERLPAALAWLACGRGNSV